MGLFDKLFGTKTDSSKATQPEKSLFTEDELNALAKEIDATHERIIISHEGSSNLKILPCFPTSALLSSSSIVNLCRKSKKDAHEYIMSYYDQGGQFLLHRKQCQYVLSLWVYQKAGANIPSKVISFVQNAVGKEEDDCEYLIKEEHLW